MAKAKKPAGKDSAKAPSGIPDFEALIRKVGDRAMKRVEEEVKKGKIPRGKQPGGDRARGELPEAEELCSNPEDAERFAEAARQAFREAHPPSRVDEIMAEAFRKAEQAALAKERAVGGGEIEALRHTSISQSGSLCSPMRRSCWHGYANAIRPAASAHFSCSLHHMNDTHHAGHGSIRSPAWRAQPQT